MDLGIRPIWEGMHRIAGPAYPVLCAPGDNLMLHAAIYRAPPGSVVVVEAGDSDYAMAGGNVCAVAKKNGIAGFVIDGVVRDVAEIRENRFPVYARGLIPKPGKKNVMYGMPCSITCGGVKIHPGDWIVADEEGIVVIPEKQLAQVLEAAQERAKKDDSESLADWEVSHRSKIDEILKEKRFEHL